MLTCSQVKHYFLLSSIIVFSIFTDLSLKLRYPDIKKFIVQDLPETRKVAETFIASKGLNDRVEFEEQDFFKPQQRKGKYVFVMQRGT